MSAKLASLGTTCIKMAAIAAVALLFAASPAWSGLPRVHEVLTHAVAASTGFWMDVIGMPAHVDGATVYGIGYALRIVPACDALFEAAVVVAACLVLEARLARRIALAAIGVVAAVAFNQVRVATTLLIGTRDSHAASIAHDVVFPLVVAALFAVLWYRWLTIESDRRAEPIAAPAGGAR